MKRKFIKHYKESIALLKNLIAGEEYGNIGFFASSVDKENYKRVFSRDAFWVGMAALVSGEEILIKGYENSLRTLAKYQREDGAIPSNVKPDGTVSYGVINIRVDSTTLFALGAIRYCRSIHNKDSVEDYFDHIERAIDYLETQWENPDTKLLYIPRAGNWADEYFQQGYVLYDEVLWYSVLEEYASMLEFKGNINARIYGEKAGKVAKMIRDRFWMKTLKNDDSNYMRKVKRLFDLDKVGYFLHYHHIQNKNEKGMGHAHRVFDAFGNILTLLTGIASDGQSVKIRRFIDEISVNSYPMIPAHYPFMMEKEFKTYKLFQYRFKEYVGHYHNGGLWPWYTGLYVAYLAKIKDKDRAMRYLYGIYRANRMKIKGRNFFEYHMNRAASMEIVVRRKDGIDLFLSMVVKNIIIDRKSMVIVKHKGKKYDLSNDMIIRDLKIPYGAELKITAVGPDADLILQDILILSDDETNCFSKAKIRIKKDKPYGIPFLGVSAAAYVIAHKAVFDNEIVLC